jgi:formylglycine-generating enzyme required for sulfatase activity
MVGNLHEWVSDRVDPSLSRKVQLLPGVRGAIPRNKGHGVFMGGFFSTTAQQGFGCNFTTIGHEPRYHDYSTGFRCCKDAE